MKKTVAVIFGMSITAGVSYLIWSYSGLGKAVLTKWLIKRWKMKADIRKKVIDWKKIETELGKLVYEDIELLVRYTRVDPKKDRKKAISYLMEMGRTGLLERAELFALDGLVLPASVKGSVIIF